MASTSAKAKGKASSVQYVVVETGSDGVHSTTGSPTAIALKQEPQEGTKSTAARREVLIRQPSYCKILDDLTGSAEAAAMHASKSSAGSSPPMEVTTTGGDASIQTITINGQQYNIVSPSALGPGAVEGLHTTLAAAAAAQQTPSSGAPSTNASSSAPGASVVQYAATSQNGQTVFLPSTAASGTTQMITVGGGGSTSAASAAPSNGVPEEAVRKREIRLLKNREAARECRNKKKEYIKCLENRVAVLENQNKALIEELKSLKELYTGQKS